MKNYKHILFPILLILLAVLLSACGDTDLMDEMADMAVEWGQEKGILDENKEINLLAAGAYQAKRTLLGTTGDSTLDAVLEGGPTIHNLHTAEELAEKGLEEGNTELIDQAIEMRPDDWSYYDKKAAILLAQGDKEGARINRDQAQSITYDLIDNLEDCKVILLNRYRNREQALITQINQGKENDDVYRQLDNAQRTIQDLEEDNKFSYCYDVNRDDE